MRWLGPCWLWIEGCQPSAPITSARVCNGVRPELGALVVAPLECEAQIPPFGEGRTPADLWLATNDYRVVLRHPQDALTAMGLGGGTIVDVAPWPGVDTMHEIVPIVGGGWLTDVTIEAEDDGYTVHGTVGPLPDREATALGEARTVRYRADPDRPFLDVEGAEGFWFHPLGDETLLDGFARFPTRMVGAVGEVVDHGGVYEVLGTDRLVIGTDLRAWEALAGDDGIHVGGRAFGAAEIALLRDDHVVGRVGIAGTEFDFLVPNDIDAVRSEAPGRWPSAEVAPSRGLRLILQWAGWITLVPVWEDGRPHWFRVDWTASDGRAGRGLLGPDGGRLGLGGGTFDLRVSAGPAFEETSLHVEIRPGEDRVLPIRLPLRIDPGSYVLAGFRRPGDRSRDWRGSDLTAARLAAAEGLTYATFTPRDDVGNVNGAVPGFPVLPFRDGLLRAGDGYSLAAWPWLPTARQQLHGAPIVPPRSAVDEAAVMRSEGRTLNVDLGWLLAAGPPYAAPPADQVWLEAPTSDLASWAPWFAWLDIARPLIPTGPATWVRVEDPLLVGNADVEQSLARGDVCAGTGPRIALVVDGVPPGEQLLPDPGLRSITVRLEGADDVDHLALVTEGGALRELPVAGYQQLTTPLEGRWVLVAAWSSEADGAWAVTGPVWLDVP